MRQIQIEVRYVVDGRVVQWDGVDVQGVDRVAQALACVAHAKAIPDLSKLPEDMSHFPVAESWRLTDGNA